MTSLRGGLFPSPGRENIATLRGNPCFAIQKPAYRIALLASLFSAPVCAQTVSAAVDGQAGQAAAAGTPESVETITVTGSRVISDVANSPTPMTVVSTDQLLTTTPTDHRGRLEQAADFPEQRRRAVT